MASEASVTANGVCNNLTTEQCTKYKNDLAAYRVALADWKKSLLAIKATRNASVQDAVDTMKSEFSAAATLKPAERRAARLLARSKFFAAVKSAKNAEKSAITALGPAPKKPIKPTTSN